MVGVEKIRESVIGGQPPLMPTLDVELRRRHGIMRDCRFEDDKVQKLWERCAKDPEFYIFGGFVRTFDTHDRRNPRKEFPDLPHLREALRFIHDCKLGEIRAITKARQMLLTWLISAYSTWEAGFNEHALAMIQSITSKESWKLVYRGNWFNSRCAFIERAKPPWFRQNGLKGIQGELVYPNGSGIWAVPRGEDVFRSYTASLVVFDEACFNETFEDSYKAALAIAKGVPGENDSEGGGRIILISTAKGNTYYAKLVGKDKQISFVQAA